MSYQIDSRDCVTCKETNCFFKQTARTEWLELLGDQKTTLIFQPGEEIFREGEVMEGVYSIHYGAVKEVMGLDSDQPEIVSFSYDGMMIGFRGLRSREKKFRTTAIALSKAEFVFFPMKGFQIALRSNPTMLERLFHLSLEELYRKETQSRWLLRASAEEKVRYVLQYFTEVFGLVGEGERKLAFTPSRKDMVSYSGLTYETVTRVLRKLKQEGFIDIRGKEIYFDESFRFV